jgi:hypothetical protein
MCSVRVFRSAQLAACRQLRLGRGPWACVGVPFAHPHKSTALLLEPQERVKFVIRVV